MLANSFFSFHIDYIGLFKLGKTNDERIRNLYDPEKDTGFMGGLKNMNYELQNKGLMTDPFAALGLKEEGTEKFVEKIRKEVNSEL